jgi:hypothetical protein
MGPAAALARLSAAAWAFTALIVLAGCPICRSAPPDAVIEKADLAALLDPIAKGITKGFDQGDVVRLAERFSLAPEGPLSVTFPDVVVGRHEPRDLWINIVKTRSVGKFDVWMSVHTPAGDVDQEPTHALRALIPARFR